MVTGSQRVLFVFALAVFALAAFYTSLALLTRVTPALFPGRDLAGIPGIGGGLNLVQQSTGIARPDEDDLFNKRINLLIMGSDQRPAAGLEELTEEQQFDGTHTDTIMIATIDPLAKTMTFLGIPRDMLITITPPDGGAYGGRINASFAEGLHAGKTVDAASKQLSGDIERNFGIAILVKP